MTPPGAASWGEILGDSTSPSCSTASWTVVLNLDGDSYRQRDYHVRTDAFRRAATGHARPSLS